MGNDKYRDPELDKLMELMKARTTAKKGNALEKENTFDVPAPEGPVKKGDIFKEGEIDSSVMIDEARKLKDALEAANKFPIPQTKLEREKEKRKLQKEKEDLIKKKKEDRKKAWKKLIIGILTGSTLIGGAVYGISQLEPKIDDNIKISNAKEWLRTLGEDNLLMYGLATRDEDGKFKIGNNSVSDYRSLDADTPLEVYVYKDIMDNEEFNKFIRSVTYDNGTYCYESYEQFLRINGFYDQTTNKISENVFANIMDGTLLTACNNSTLSSYEEDFYTSDLSSPKTR